MPPPPPPREIPLLPGTLIRAAAGGLPCILEGASDLVSACRELARHGVTEALVRDGTRSALFTAADLPGALLRAEAPRGLALREVVRFDAAAADADSGLAEALSLMRREGVQHLLVRDGGEVPGVLRALDAAVLLARRADLPGMAIDGAASVDELQAAAARVDATVVELHEGGVAVERIARLVSDLNTRVFRRLWSLLAPPELVANSCLVVMGSEGRGEQLLKTDQDNALLLRDGFEFAGLEEIAERFQAALAALGWPPCPGGIMLTNPVWRQPLAGFRDALRDWVHGHGAQGPMRLAIFLDAAAVAGDASLLGEARAHLDRIVVDSDARLARFAAAADQFAEPGNWWARLTGHLDDLPLDLKKVGTFPIVHGLRALSLQHGVHATSSAERARLLADKRRLDPELARDIVDALHAFMALRLARQLAQRVEGIAPGNLVVPAELATLERHRLHGALDIVKRFRHFLRGHFRLDSL